MTKISGFILLVALVTLSACGAGNDAKDVCNCYKEVYSLKGEESDKKMEECIKLMQEYTQKHEEAGSIEEFTEALNECR